MTMLNRRTLTPPPLPADFAAGHPDLAKLIEELARHRADRSQVRQERMALENRLPVARSQDQAIATDAFRRGERDPGTPNADKLYKDITPLSNREAKLRLAIEATERDLVTLHAAHSADWLVEALQRATQAREAAELALAALRDAFNDVSDADALAAWCAGRKYIRLAIHGAHRRGSVESVAEALDRVGRALTTADLQTDEEAEVEEVA